MTSDTRYTEFVCGLCKKKVLSSNGISLLFWVFHGECYRIVYHRLAGLSDKLTLPEKEFDEWMVSRVDLSSK